MITAAKLRIYQQYEGNIDGFTRAGSATQKAQLSTKEWYLLEELIEAVRLENSGLLVESLRRKLREQLEVERDNTETINMLRQELVLPAAPDKRWRLVWLTIGGALVLALLAGYLLLAGK